MASQALDIEAYKELQKGKWCVPPRVAESRAISSGRVFREFVHAGLPGRGKLQEMPKKLLIFRPDGFRVC